MMFFRSRRIRFRASLGWGYPLLILAAKKGSHGGLRLTSVVDPSGDEVVLVPPAAAAAAAAEAAAGAGPGGAGDAADGEGVAGGAGVSC